MKADITVGPVGEGTFLLDGEDISHGVSGFQIQGRVGEMTKLHLDIAAPSNIHFVGDVEVTIPDAVRKILLHMGWTPPPAEEES